MWKAWNELVEGYYVYIRRSTLWSSSFPPVPPPSCSHALFPQQQADYARHGRVNLGETVIYFSARYRQTVMFTLRLIIGNATQMYVLILIKLLLFAFPMIVLQHEYKSVTLHKLTKGLNQVFRRFAKHSTYLSSEREKENLGLQSPNATPFFTAAGTQHHTTATSFSVSAFPYIIYVHLFSISQ